MELSDYDNINYYKKKKKLTKIIEYRGGRADTLYVTLNQVWLTSCTVKPSRQMIGCYSIILLGGYAPSQYFNRFDHANYKVNYNMMYYTGMEYKEYCFRLRWKYITLYITISKMVVLDSEWNGERVSFTTMRVFLFIFFRIELFLTQQLLLFGHYYPYCIRGDSFSLDGHGKPKPPSSCLNRRLDV